MATPLSKDKDYTKMLLLYRLCPERKGRCPPGITGIIRIKSQLWTDCYDYCDKKSFAEEEEFIGIG